MTYSMTIQDVLNNAVALHSKGELDAAENLYLMVLQHYPEHPDINSAFSMLKQEQGYHNSALKHIQIAIEHRPNMANYHFQLGNIYLETRHFKPAIAAYETATKLMPRYADAWLNLGNVYREVDFLEKALNCYEKARMIEPANMLTLNNLAVIYKDIGQTEKAHELYSKTIDTHTPLPATYSGWLMNLHYQYAEDLEKMKDAHQKWAKQFATHTRTHRFKNNLNPDRKLKIGYVSADMRRHPVGYFMHAPLEQHNRDDMHVTCYVSNPVSDDLTTILKNVSDAWHDVSKLSDEALAKRIEEDEIDILVDLSGHTGHHRLMSFVQKPAPIQISWCGYFNTTGIKQIDYFISDATHMTKEAEETFSETILYPSPSYICYTPPDYAPEPPDTAPVEKNGYITFGSFNHLPKMTPDVVACWSKILKALPTAKLWLKSRMFDHQMVRDDVLSWFATHAIGEEQLILDGWSPHKDMLAQYHEMDIALDPFPFTGGLTSCEALWMGVPIVTLAGKSIVSRQTTTYLTQVGLECFSAKSQEDYIKCALELAQTPETLHDIRRTLRDKMHKSPLCDGKTFTQNLEKTYRNIWQEWCQNQSK